MSMGGRAGQTDLAPPPFPRCAPVQTSSPPPLRMIGTTMAAPTNPPAVDPATEAAGVFSDVWAGIEKLYRHDDLCFPRQIVWLNGAPGAGKGTNVKVIQDRLGITAKPLVCSDLFNSPEFKRIKDSGALIGDREVISLLLRALLAPEYANGVVVDGYPRTRTQAETLKLFHAKLVQLQRELPAKPAPSFRVVVIDVSEQESVARQLKRGREALAHNAQVKATGVGTLLEIRATDTDEALVRKRYQEFVAKTIGALEVLKGVFPYHRIDGSGSIEETRQKIVQEFPGAAKA